jgi:glycosyltransferase involved in cell wall biosynthesis
MRFGSGIQVKLLESLALGTPAVATESVAGAFGEEGKKAILVGRNPGEFADQVTKILQNQAYREQLRQAGRELIETHFQWEQVLAPLDRILDGLAEKQSQAQPEFSMKGKTSGDADGTSRYGSNRKG